MQTIIKPPHGTLDWHNIRHRDDHGHATLGASEAPALAEASQFMSRTDLWYRKMTAPQISEPSPAMHFGNIAEPMLVKELSRIIGIDMITPDVMYRKGRWTVTLDAVGATHIIEPTVIGEIKTTRRHAISSIDDVPAEYRWQCWAQQYVTGADVWLCTLDRNLNISVIEMPRSEQANEWLAAEAERFCAGIDSGDATPTEIIEHLSAEQIAGLYQPTMRIADLPLAALDWIRDLDEARDLKKQADMIETAARDHLARLLLDADAGAIDGKTVVTWKQQAGRQTVDMKTLRAEHTALIDGYTTQGEPFRVMRTVKEKAAR